MASHFVRWMYNPERLPGTLTLPQEVVDSAPQYTDKRRGCFLATRLILAELLRRVYGIAILPTLTTAANGRPCFIDPDMPDFSISYAGNLVGVLLAEENNRAGLDMEIVRAHSRQAQENLLQGLSSGEKAWINEQQDFMEAVTQIWTLRQSVIKLTGDIGCDDEDALRLHPAYGRLRSVHYSDIQAICNTEPTLVWSCALSPATERLRLWEIDGYDQWKALRDMELKKPNMGPRALRLTSLPGERVMSQAAGY
ncbi:phosphopantetheinyl transferase [Pantoea sp.]|uniref:4'-phosphopantetheinyl transferase family protein n=1 Tax=Pantoea sp. TaxID=69393 RepID=UPI00289D201A|nr:phosphopantetheinyl transferase [Pantoea sp.]